MPTIKIFKLKFLLLQRQRILLKVNNPFKSFISPSQGVSILGKIVIGAIHYLYIFLARIFNYDRRIPKDVEENPRYMKTKDALYLGYKYYGENIVSGKKLKNPIPLNNQLQWKNPLDQFLSPSLTIHIGGDMMPYKMVNSNQADKFWEHRSDYFNADIVAANLETPINSKAQPRYVPELMFNHMKFNSSIDQFEIFNGNSKGLDIVSLANNHVLDQGYQGIESTMNFLSQRNTKFCGVGQNKCYQIIEKNGIKVGFMAFTFSLNEFEIDLKSKIQINAERLNLPAFSDISRLKEEAEMIKKDGANYIILMLHTGNAYQPFPSQQTQTLYNKLLKETSVDFIAGHHPHNIQGIELLKLKNKYKIGAYSLGDFIAYDIYQRSHLNMFLKLELAYNKNQEIELKSLQIELNYLDYSNKHLQLIPFKEARIKYAHSNKIKDLEVLCKQILGKQPI